VDTRSAINYLIPRNYFKKSIIDTLREKRIIIYGTGQGYTTFSIFVLNRYGLKPYAIIDKKNNPIEKLKLKKEEKDEVIVIITTGSYHKEIISILKKNGYKNIILSTDIYEYHLLHNPEVYNNQYYIKNKSLIIEGFDLLSDDLSREVFLACLHTHMQRCVIPIPFSPIDEQYFPRDVQLKKGFKRFINCGAFDGDTIRQLNLKYGKVESIICFEPDLQNFEKLCSYVGNHHKSIADSVVLHPLGVYSHETTVCFDGKNGTNSTISDNGDVMIKCVSLDNLFLNFSPTYINMDIEGAELEALKGAKGIITKSRPDLAICVYHEPAHLWDIIIYLSNLKCGYKFYMRNYSGFISETVLYATSDE
jgi:FkbM family methyltransferase